LAAAFTSFDTFAVERSQYRINRTKMATKLFDDPQGAKRANLFPFWTIYCTSPTPSPDLFRRAHFFLSLTHIDKIKGILFKPVPKLLLTFYFIRFAFLIDLI